ncbi:MAG TPA: DUF3800 domain-containing protein [Candidatus Paceibacterota bacterium]
MSMWYLYLDESGDLGFDFINKKPSKFFTITILAINSIEANRKMAKNVRKTIQRKLNPKRHRKRIVHELKGNSTTLEIKKYFYKQAEKTQFGIYAISLNKERVYERLRRSKPRVYNYIARKVLDQIPFEKNHDSRVELVIDRSMSKPEIEEFNSYIRKQLEARLDPKTPLDIYHWDSQATPGLQAADIFCWGIFQKYERRKTEWRDVFESKILFDDQYL